MLIFYGQNNFLAASGTHPAPITAGACLYGVVHQKPVGCRKLLSSPLFFQISSLEFNFNIAFT
jgi:hypothetical protein